MAKRKRAEGVIHREYRGHFFDSVSSSPRALILLRARNQLNRKARQLRKTVRLPLCRPRYRKQAAQRRYQRFTEVVWNLEAVILIAHAFADGMVELFVRTEVVPLLADWRTLYKKRWSISSG